jgi:hypothetical protein
MINCVCKVGTGRRPVICTFYTSHCSLSFTLTMTDTAGWKTTHSVASQYKGHALAQLPDIIPVSATFGGAERSVVVSSSS